MDASKLAAKLINPNMTREQAYDVLFDIRNKQGDCKATERQTYQEVAKAVMSLIDLFFNK